MLINYREEAISRNRQFEYIPIDFIKCKIINFPKEELLNNPLLDFISHVNLETGELKPKREAYYKNLKFKKVDLLRFQAPYTSILTMECIITMIYHT
jgi:catechol-2,3-dioxygenase